ncbi:hypothetical protein [Demequina globuliformis]|uniref:hypothetical protein n=1 Tax=Demequina globuliformis TaxID=676202 RepID=UPI000783AB0E|nr:hypothetical protein [Demequina globuliformis]
MSAGELLFLAVAVVLGTYGVRQVASGRPTSVLLTLASTAIYVLCLWVPARLQLAGLTDSKLVDAGFANPITSSEIAWYSLRWSIELLVLGAGEFLGWRTRKGRATPQVAPIVDKAARWERVAYLLVIVGTLAMVVLPQTALEDRGAGGQGFEILLKTCLVTGLAVMIYFRAFGRPLGWLVVVAGVAVLIAGNVRSPLLVLVCAFIASEATLGRLARTRRVALLVALVLTFALAGSVMSGLRANTTRDYGYSTSEVIQESLSHPWVAPYEAGLDTLDGYRFSDSIHDREEARPEDLANVVLTFIPRSLWPDKPTSLAVDMSAKYLGYGTSGQYLSPAGYLTLVLGSYPAALLALFAFSLAMSLLARAYATSLGLVFVLVAQVRFLLGGSSFDLYYALFLCVTLIPPLALVRLFEASRRPGTSTARTFTLEPTASARSTAAEARGR